MRSKSAVIVASGSYLPEKIVTNLDLEKIVETTDSWIVERTGIKQRHIAGDHEPTSFMAAKASLQALQESGLAKEDIDLVIVATTSPDNTFPSVAVRVQSALGLKKAAAFDVQAVCAGFIYALSIADSFIQSGSAKNVLVVGCDRMSNLVDWQDRSTCVLFGDGAGAVILSAKASSAVGIIACSLQSDGDLSHILYTDGGPGSNQQVGKLRMLGKEVFKQAVEAMSSSIIALLQQLNLSVDQIDLLVPHQANLRILEAVGRRLSLPTEKLICTLDQHANTSAASIPLALDYALKHHRVKAGDLVMLTALGGGLCWGSCAIRWQ